MKCSLALASFLFASMLCGSFARADIPPPEIEPCKGKAAGDPCVYNGTGTCQNQMCTSAVRNSTPYACLECITATSTNTSTATSTNTDPSTKDGGSCSIGKHPTAGRIAPWLLASAVSLLLARRRRRS